MSKTVKRLRADRDRVLNAITEAPDVSNSLILYTLVKTLTRSVQHIIVTADNEKRGLTPYEEGHVLAWTAVLKQIAKDLDVSQRGRNEP